MRPFRSPFPPRLVLIATAALAGAGCHDGIADPTPRLGSAPRSAADRAPAPQSCVVVDGVLICDPRPSTGSVPVPTDSLAP